MTQKLFCFGQGYSAQALVRHLHQQEEGSWQVGGTSRTGEGNFLFDGTRPMADAAGRLGDVTHMLISIAPQAAGDPVLNFHGRDIAKLKKLQWLGYLSTTGVYGDRGGAWVDDNAAPAPTSDRGRQRLEAEQGWLQLFHDHGIPVHIFRLGSIYGPGRGHLANLMSGRVTTALRTDHFFSRIHVDDLARVLMASRAVPCPGRSYNVVDDRPAPSHEVLDYICDLLGRSHLPRTETRDMSAMMKSFYGENKRVDNGRLTQELGIMLKYPTYKEGFSHLVRTLL